MGSYQPWLFSKPAFPQTAPPLLAIEYLPTLQDLEQRGCRYPSPPSRSDWTFHPVFKLCIPKRVAALATRILQDGRRKNLVLTSSHHFDPFADGESMHPIASATSSSIDQYFTRVTASCVHQQPQSVPLMCLIGRQLSAWKGFSKRRLD